MSIRISDEGRKSKYWTDFPNTVNDMGLSTQAFRLYICLKVFAGDNGECWQSTDTLAKKCRMSKSTVCSARKELIDNGLISVKKVSGKGGGFYYVTTINDIWAFADTSPPMSPKEIKEKESVGSQELFRSEKEIEDFIYNNPELVFTLTGSKVVRWLERQLTIPSGRIDLLGIDEDHNYVVVEIKKNSIDSSTLTQVTRYAKDIEEIVINSAARVHKVVIGNGLKAQTLNEAYALEIKCLKLKTEPSLNSYDFTEKEEETRSRKLNKLAKLSIFGKKQDAK